MDERGTFEMQSLDLEDDLLPLDGVRLPLLLVEERVQLRELVPVVAQGASRLLEHEILAGLQGAGEDGEEDDIELAVLPQAASQKASQAP